jgi:hypothetical protein
MAQSHGWDSISSKNPQEQLQAPSNGWVRIHSKNPSGTTNCSVTWLGQYEAQAQSQAQRQGSIYLSTSQVAKVVFTSAPVTWLGLTVYTLQFSKNSWIRKATC